MNTSIKGRDKSSGEEKLSMMIDDASIDIRMGALESGIGKLNWVISENSKMKIQVAKLLNSLALIELGESSPSSSLYNANRLLEACLLITSEVSYDDSVTHAMTLCNIGVCLRRQGKLSSSLDALMQSLMVIKETNDEACAGNIYLNIAILHSQMGLHDKAIVYAKKALAQCDKQQQQQKQMIANFNLGIGSTDNEISTASRILCHRTLALEEAAIKKFKAAESHFVNAIKIAEKNLGDSHSITLACKKDYDKFLQRQNDEGDVSPASYTSFREVVTSKVGRKSKINSEQKKNKELENTKRNYQKEKELFTDSGRKKQPFSEELTDSRVLPAAQRNDNEQGEINNDSKVELLQLQKLYNDACLKLETQRPSQQPTTLPVEPIQQSSTIINRSQQQMLTAPHRSPAHPERHSQSSLQVSQKLQDTRRQPRLLTVIDNFTILEVNSAEQTTMEVTGRVIVEIDEDNSEIIVRFQYAQENRLHRIIIKELIQSQRFTLIAYESDQLAVDIVEQLLPLFVINAEQCCLTVMPAEVGNSQEALRRSEHSKAQPIKLKIDIDEVQSYLLQQTPLTSLLYFEERALSPNVQPTEEAGKAVSNPRRSNDPNSPNGVDIQKEFKDKDDIKNHQESTPSEPLHHSSFRTPIPAVSQRDSQSQLSEVDNSKSFSQKKSPSAANSIHNSQVERIPANSSNIHNSHDSIQQRAAAAADINNSQQRSPANPRQNERDDISNSGSQPRYEASSSSNQRSPANPSKKLINSQQLIAQSSLKHSQENSQKNLVSSQQQKQQPMTSSSQQRSPANPKQLNGSVEQHSAQNPSQQLHPITSSQHTSTLKDSSQQDNTKHPLLMNDPSTLKHSRKSSLQWQPADQIIRQTHSQLSPPADFIEEQEVAEEDPSLQQMLIPQSIVGSMKLNNSNSPQHSLGEPHKESNIHNSHRAPAVPLINKISRSQHNHLTPSINDVPSNLSSSHHHSARTSPAAAAASVNEIHQSQHSSHPIQVSQRSKSRQQSDEHVINNATPPRFPPSVIERNDSNQKSLSQSQEERQPANPINRSTVNLFGDLGDIQTPLNVKNDDTPQPPLEEDDFQPTEVEPRQRVTTFCDSCLDHLVDIAIKQESDRNILESTIVKQAISQRRQSITQSQQLLQEQHRKSQDK